MEIKNLGAGNSLLNRFVSELRDAEVQKDTMRFRCNVARIGEIFAYEISKELVYRKFSIETPLGTKVMDLDIEDIVVVSILRAGLPLHEGVLSFFDRASNGFISAYRKHDETGTFNIQLGYASCPNLEGKTLILCDPMLATGASMEICYNSLLEYGKPSHTHIVSVIAAQEGLNHLKRVLNYKNIDVWIAALDEELTAQSYIVPGLGDAGDLAYGPKLQE